MCTRESECIFLVHQGCGFRSQFWEAFIALRLFNEQSDILLHLQYLLQATSQIKLVSVLNVTLTISYLISPTILESLIMWQAFTSINTTTLRSAHGTKRVNSGTQKFQQYLLMRKAVYAFHNVGLFKGHWIIDTNEHTFLDNAARKQRWYSHHHHVKIVTYFRNTRGDLHLLEMSNHYFAKNSLVCTNYIKFSNFFCLLCKASFFLGLCPFWKTTLLLVRVISIPKTRKIEWGIKCKTIMIDLL